MAEQIDSWCGWNTQGGSDKVWGGAVVETSFRSVWGKRGSALMRGEKICKTADEARKLYNKKVTEKASEGYKPVPFNDPQTGIPFLFDEQATGASAVTVTQTNAPKETVYASGHVMPMDAAELDAAIASSAHALSEKVNGERCLIGFDGTTIRAYNRKGQQVSLAPRAAQDLAGFGHQFVLDGERMTGIGQGSYVIFDVLEWKGENVRSLPYTRRIAILETAIAALGVARSIGPSIENMALNSLYLLTAEVDATAGRALAERVLARNGEGVIIRTMDAPYVEGDTRHVRKVKYVATLDAFVTAINPGLATGSVTLALMRPTDGAIIEICNVRSGLKDADIEGIGEMLARGERPVLEVEYLPARSVTHKIVEPKTAISRLRTDKAWQECTTAQLGAEKAAIVAAARGRVPAYR